MDIEIEIHIRATLMFPIVRYKFYSLFQLESFYYWSTLFNSCSEMNGIVTETKSLKKIQVIKT